MYDISFTPPYTRSFTSILTSQIHTANKTINFKAHLRSSNFYKTYETF